MPITQTDDDEKMHELRASFAGLASAIRLIVDHGADLTNARRAQLGTMLTSEVDRLERLLCPRVLARPEAVELDPVMSSLVTTRGLAGQHIDWAPTGCRVRGSADLVATAVNILLVNAAVHAPGAPVRLSATRDGAVVRIVVADRGPGIPRDLRSRLFTRGVRGRKSPGQGIGLQYARRIALEQGGSLQLKKRERHGTAFEMTLPSAPVEGAR